MLNIKCRNKHVPWKERQNWKAWDILKGVPAINGLYLLPLYISDSHYPWILDLIFYFYFPPSLLDMGCSSSLPGMFFVSIFFFFLKVFSFWFKVCLVAEKCGKSKANRKIRSFTSEKFDAACRFLILCSFVFIYFFCGDFQTGLLGFCCFEFLRNLNGIRVNLLGFLICGFGDVWVNRGLMSDQVF